MLSVLVFVLPLPLCAIALLTLVRVPAHATWKPALLAGECGHWLSVLGFLVGLTAFAQAIWFPSGLMPGAEFLAFGLTTTAITLLLRPAWVAWQLAQGLPARLTAAFGSVEEKPGRTFDPHRLWLPSRVRPVLVETHVFAYPGTSDALALDFYRPGGRSPAPCVIVIHGGGWDSGDRLQLATVNHLLAGRGYAVAAISYRLAPRHRWPAQRDDVLAAIAWLKEHAAALQIDPARLVLLGRSAGGQLAAAVGYGAHDPAIRGVVAYYAPHDMRFVWSIARDDDLLESAKLMRQYFGGPPEGELAAAYESASGQLLVRRGETPPTLLLHGTMDELVWVRHSVRLAQRLEEEDVPHLFVELPWATHAFDFNPDGPGGQIGMYALLHFLAAVTH